MGDLRVRVLINPAAAGGAAFRSVRAVGAAMRHYDLTHEILLTRAPGHATELAHAARADGVDVIAVVGGDGTLNEVVQAYLDEEGKPLSGPDLSLLPLGTGGDFKRTLGLSGSLREAVGRIRFGARRAVDMGILALAGPTGEDLRRAFVNVASFGIGGHVDRYVEEGPKWLGGRAAFFLASVRAKVRYRNVAMRVSIDGAPWIEGPALNVAIANGRYFGGGMMIAPHADPSDGRFEVVALGDMDFIDSAVLAGPLYRGAHLGLPGVRVAHGARIEAESVHPWETVLIDMDGEQPGKLPLRASVAPGALSFRA